MPARYEDGTVISPLDSLSRIWVQISLNTESPAPPPHPTVASLEFHVQPDGAAVDTVFTTQPVVRALDSLGAVVTSFTGDITVAIHSGPAGLLSGTLVIPAVAGVATFTDLQLTPEGDYTLRATDGTNFVYSDEFTVAGYYLTFDPSDFDLEPSDSEVVTITSHFVSGDNAAQITLTLPDLPDGWSGDFDDDTIDVDGGVAHLTLTAP